MKRLAIFSTGGIGAGVFSQGQPVLGKIVEELSLRFDVTFYSLAPVDPDFRPRGYRIRAPSARVDRIRVKGLRWTLLAARFLRDHATNRYHRTLSFWGYPMGTAVVALSIVARVPSTVLLLGAETADLPSIGYGHMRRRVPRALVLWTCAHASALVVVAKAQGDVLRAKGLVRDDVHVVPLGAEPELFAFETKTRSGPLKILHVANLTAVKDQATLVDAFAMVAKQMNARLRIVGGDFLDGAIQARAQALGLGDVIEFAGPVAFTDMPAHYRWADMFVLTSLSEGQNRSLTEAALCGVLQVSTPVGHIKDLGDDVAVVVAPGDPADVAAKIRDVAADESGWRRRVAAARAWAAAHTMDWTVARLGEILESARCSEGTRRSEGTH